MASTVTILIDFIHVLEYLWKAAWCFHPPRPAIEAWVTAQGWILHGRAAQVADDPAAAGRPPRPAASTPRSSQDPDLPGRQGTVPGLPPRLAAGWPIATGVIEGTCRYLVKDRLAITGARWSLPGAEAVLLLRAVITNGDFDAYWRFHLQREHQRTHLCRAAASAS